MKSMIFSFVKISNDSMVASVRIARYLSNLLGIPVVHNESIDEKLDVLIIVNGAFGFCKYLEPLASAIVKADRVIWIQNDYTIIPPKEFAKAESPFRLAFQLRYQNNRPAIDYWTTVKPMSVPGKYFSSKQDKVGRIIGDSSMYVNWNALTMNGDLVIKPFSDRRHADSMVYYGSYRNRRERYFEAYFYTTPVDVTISSPSKKFAQKFFNPRISHIPEVPDVYSFLRDYGLGLYLEDKQSHDEFHSPANRFYEMLSAGLPMVFQPESSKMMREAGYDVMKYTTWDREKDITDMMRAKEDISREQEYSWLSLAQSERASLDNIVLEAWKNL